MDKNQAIGLVLISAILGIYMYFAPAPEQIENQTVNTELTDTVKSKEVTQLKAVLDTAAISDSIIDLKVSAEFGVFAPFANENNKLITIESNTSKYTFNTKGGTIEKVELKNYLTYNQEPLILFDDETHSEKFTFQTHENKKINLNELNFSTASSDVNIENDSTTISFKLEIGNNQFIEKQYTIYADKFEVGYKLHFNGLENIINTSTLNVAVNDLGKHFEKDITQSRYRSTINYKLTNGDFDYLTERSTDEQTEDLEDIQWFSFKQKFFNKTIIAKEGISKAKVTTTVDESSDEFTKKYSAEYKLDYNTLTTGKENFLLYYGPNKYSILESVGYEMERNIYLGIPLIRQINEYIILPLFNFISSIFGNFGLVIFLLVLIIKIAIFPFTFKSYKGFAKMRVLKPELDELKKECGDDNTKYQQEQMKVYQKFGVSPLSGCIPMLFQMPFLFALFQLFPSSIELRGQSFLWAEDLSSYDAFFTWTNEIPFLGTHISLFTMLMTASTIAYTYVSQQVTPTQTAPGQPNMKVMSYMMPVVFFFVLNDYASGLTYYYFLSNIITMSQQLLSKKFIDEDKILAKMKSYSEKSGSKKQSSFSKRLEDAMKAQQEKKKNNK